MAGVLIHIGYPKAGSSFLQEWFARHPGLHFNGRSIAGFHDAWEIARYAQNTQKIHDCFVMSCGSLIAWRGDVDPVGLRYRNYDVADYQEKVSTTLCSLFPAAKILVVIRGFRSMLLSTHAEYVAVGGILPFNHFYEKYLDGLVIAYNYDRVVRLFSMKFGSSNVLVLPFELMRDDPSSFTSRIEKFIGLGYDFKISFEKINASPGTGYLEINRRVSEFIFNTIRLVPYSFQQKIYGTYIKYLRKNNKNVGFFRFFSQVSGKAVPPVLDDEKLKPFAGNGAALKNIAEFQSYRKEYLL